MSTAPPAPYALAVADLELDLSVPVPAEQVLVIVGRATVEIEGGPTLELAPGVAGALPAGARTIWRVTEKLRKVYVITLD